MAKKKVSINITKTDYAYIDGESGEEISRDEFVQKTRGLNLGGHRQGVQITDSEGEIS